MGLTVSKSKTIENCFFFIDGQQHELIETGGQVSFTYCNIDMRYTASIDRINCFNLIFYI